MHLTVMNGGIDGPNLERESLWHGIEAAVAEGVAAQQAPGCQQCPTNHPEAANRLGGIVRAARLVATAAREPGRDPSLIEANRGEKRPFHVERFFPAEPARASSMLARTPEEPSRSIRSPISGRATKTKSCC